MKDGCQRRLLEQWRGTDHHRPDQPSSRGRRLYQRLSKVVMLFALSYSLHARYYSLLVDTQQFELYLYTVSSSRLQADPSIYISWQNVPVPNAILAAFC